MERDDRQDSAGVSLIKQTPTDRAVSAFQKKLKGFQETRQHQELEEKEIKHEEIFRDLIPKLAEKRLRISRTHAEEFTKEELPVLIEELRRKTLIPAMLEMVPPVACSLSMCSIVSALLLGSDTLGLVGFAGTFVSGAAICFVGIATNYADVAYQRLYRKLRRKLGAAHPYFALHAPEHAELPAALEDARQGPV